MPVSKKVVDSASKTATAVRIVKEAENGLAQDLCALSEVENRHGSSIQLLGNWDE